MSTIPQHVRDKDELVYRVKAAMTAVAPEDLSIDELRGVAAIVEPAVDRTPTNPGGGEELRSHYVWLLRRMLGDITPDDLATQTMAELVTLLMPDHSRIIGGVAPGKGSSTRPRDAAILQLVPRSGDGGA